MEKIRTLLEQIGGSKELVDQIMESLEQFKMKAKSDVKEEFTNRVEKAKEVCIEELEDYKKKLARKVEVYLESKEEQIRRQIEKQVAIRDSEAEAKLQSIAGLLEGVEVDAEGTNRDLQAAKKRVKELTESLKKTRTQAKVLAEKVNRSYAIAERTLERNKVLAEELQKATNSEIVEEDVKAQKPSKKKKAIEEEKKEKGKKIDEGRKVPKSSVANRSKESQVAKPQQPVSEKPATQHSMGFTPVSIAESME